MPRTTKSVRSQCLWTVVLLLPGVSAAQNTALHITVVSGEGAIHSAGAHVTKRVVIQVTDGAGKPVEGARASFQLPENGPGGVFSSGLRTDLAITDSSGRAILRGLKMNGIAGQFNIRITAAKDQARAGIVVRQSIGNESAAAERTAPPPAAPVSAAPANPEPAIAMPAKPKPSGSAPLKAAIQASASPVAAQAKPAPESPVSLAQSRPARVPTIVVTQRTLRPISGRGAASGHKSHKKWVWIGIVAAGGAAGAFTGSSLGAAAAAHGSPGAVAASTAAVSIGTPTISLGKP